nr:RHS repeat-associated core domain-containing protein [Prevotella sp.]
MILNDVGYALYNKDNNLSFHYYLKDHLGNNRVVVSEDGEIEQVNDYYPTGALMASSKGGDTQCFKFNGKELDRTNGLNWYDYGARNYDAAIVRWDGMDKLCEKYYPFTPYGYCKNNFVNAIDLDGNRIVVWYKDDKGKDKSFVFTGKKIKIPDNQFVRDFVQAYNYNVGNGGGKAMQFAAKADYDYHIEDATNQEEVVTIYHNGGRNDKVIFWESRKGLLLSNGGRQSAATRLEHEFDHYVDDVKNHKAHSDRQNVYKTSYKNMEEYRVISGNEAFTAKRNGEGVRHNHYGKTYKTKSSTSIY